MVCSGCIHFTGRAIVELQVGKSLDKQKDIISSGGEMLPVLRKNFLHFTESIRRDLEPLYALGRSQYRRQVPKLEEIISISEDKK